MEPTTHAMGIPGAVRRVTFRGEFEHSLDDKGRVIIPKAFREAFADGAYVTRGFEGCVWVLPTALWTDISGRLDETMLTDFASRELDRMLYSGMEQAFDKQGRLTVPPYLREHAGLSPGRPAAVLGVKNRLELWEPERWRQHSAKMIERLAESLEGAQALGI